MAGCEMEWMEGIITDKLHKHKPYQYMAALVFLVLITIFCTCLYRLRYHPLSRFPGPVLGRATAWQNWYHAVQGDRHIWLHNQHRRYGPIVRFAPNSLSFNTASAVGSIYGSRKANSAKSDWYQCVRDSAGGFVSTFTATDPARHATKRRLLSHAFSSEALRSMEPCIVGHVWTWIECLGLKLESASRHEWGSESNIGTLTDLLIFDILGDLCFGKSFDMMKSPEHRFLVPLIPQATGGWYTLGYHPYSHLLRYILFKTPLGPLLGGKTFEDNRIFRAFCTKALKARRRVENCTNGELTSASSKGMRKDMFHYLLRGKDPKTGRGYAVGELECESVLLMVAGSESTSTALAASMYYLVHNSDALEKLTLEVREAFASRDEIRYEAGGKLASLPYLRACLDESLRLTPSTPGHLPREVLRGGMLVDGEWIPSGTNVGASAYALHRNEAYYPHADDFRPERWTCEEVRSGKGEAVTAREAFWAFSSGPTGCIGKQLAYMELSLAVAALLWSFDIRAAESARATEQDSTARNVKHNASEFQVKDVFVGVGEGPIVQLRRR